MSAQALCLGLCVCAAVLPRSGVQRVPEHQCGLTTPEADCLLCGCCRASQDACGAARTGAARRAQPVAAGGRAAGRAARAGRARPDRLPAPGLPVRAGAAAAHAAAGPVRRAGQGAPPAPPRRAPRLAWHRSHCSQSATAVPCRLATALPGCAASACECGSPLGGRRTGCHLLQAPGHVAHAAAPRWACCCCGATA